jgi:hypothetical protein
MGQCYIAPSRMSCAPLSKSDQGALPRPAPDDHPTVWPPLTTMACPTTKEAASEHSQTTAAAISSDFPIRPIGSCAITASRPSEVPPVNCCIISVSMMPGQTALTRMLDCA